MTRVSETGMWVATANGMRQIVDGIMFYAKEEDCKCALKQVIAEYAKKVTRGEMTPEGFRASRFEVRVARDYPY